MTPAVTLSDLQSAVRSWWEAREDLMDHFMKLSKTTGAPGGADLWNGMPELDSKAIAETSPIFEALLGIPLDPTLIRPGGYNNIGEFESSDLLLKMFEESRKKRKERNSGEATKRGEEK